MEPLSAPQAASDSPEIVARYQGELSLVVIIAKQVKRCIGGAVDYEDLLGAGREGLFDAARKYDVSRGIPFRAYASLRVRGAMLDGVRRQSYLPRRAHERVAALEAALATAQGEVEGAHSPNARQLAAGAAERKLAAHMASVATAVAMTLAAATCSDDASRVASADEQLDPEEQLAQAELLDLIRRAIDEMAPDEAGVIRAYYFEGKSMNDIAEQENISKSWVCRIHAQAIGRLTRRIKNAV